MKIEMLQEAISQSYEGILLSHKDGRIFYANDAVASISGVSLDQIVGSTVKEMEEKGLIISQSIRVLSKNPLTMYQKLSTGKEIFITSKPVLGKNGKLVCYIANYRDLSTLNSLYEDHFEKISVDYMELERLRQQMMHTEDLISVSHEMEQIFEKVHKIAQTDATTLITGESGTGKEVIAKMIHKLSNRSSGPYIQINCGAIPENLIESELFGHEKGSFTGANMRKIGLLEAAHNGTILLDEIGEMPLHLQVKLLRAIQTNEITSIGSTKKKQLDIRYLAATNKDLKKLVEEGTFREDLYYRLYVVPIKLPALRERTSDISLLAQHFLKKFNSKYEKKLAFTGDSIRSMEGYEWPGNVRQLINMVEQLVILSESSFIEKEHLPFETIQVRSNNYDNQKVMPLKDTLVNIERKEIYKALQQFPSIRQAASALQVNHATLLRKIKKYQIQTP